MTNSQKAIFLLPLLDNSGQPFPASDWDWLTDELVARFGGWTFDGKVEGAWLDRQSGRVYRDASARYVVVVERPAMGELFTFLGDVKNRFRQEALFVELPQTEVHFV
jgi:hypothetical protein